MLTPKFSLSQSEGELIVKIHAPFSRISDTDINIEGNTFIFYSSPYYLRLTLQAKLIDSEKELHKATFDIDEQSFIIKCIKQTFGEHFDGLDMLTQLLTPRGTDKVNKPLIEVIGGDETQDAEEEDFEWLYKQTLPPDETADESKVLYDYGFANSHLNVFTTLRSEFSGLVDITDPDTKPVPQRRKERMEMEQVSFDEDHYLADLFEKEPITPCIEFQPTFYNLKKEEVEYTSEEQESLLKMPRKEILVDPGTRASVYFSLIDILFAWCYNHRITQGENCSESAWNIAKLSCTLSWLDCPCGLKDAATCVLRRSLVIPLVRNWEVSLLSLQDAIQILSLGKKQILKCFLEIHSLFNNYEPYYILNQLYITEYCVWMQTLKDSKLDSISDSLRKVSVSKEEMNLELVELECAAQMVLREDEEEGRRKRREGEENLNTTIQALDRMSVIENAFALERNDNDIPDSTPPHATANPFLALSDIPPPFRAPIAAISDSDDDSSDEDSSDSDSSDDDDSSSSNSDSSSSSESLSV